MVCPHSYPGTFSADHLTPEDMRAPFKPAVVNTILTQAVKKRMKAALVAVTVGWQRD